MGRARTPNKLREAESYKHPESESPMRPDVGTQAQFKKKRPPVTYRYDSSLSPALDWDGQNSTREVGEHQLSVVRSQLSEIRRKLSEAWQLEPVAKNLAEAERAVETLKSISKPFLNWAGKAERLSFDVPTLPLFVHERLSTKAIIDTLVSHKRDKQQTMFELFGDPQHSVTDQVLRAYEHRDKWVNRMVLGDSLVAMNSLLHYEGLGGQVHGIVPQITLESIANNEPLKEEVLVDRPEVDGKITRVTGQFCVEATIPTPMELSSVVSSQSSVEGLKTEDRGPTTDFTDRMLAILRKSPVLRLEGNRSVTLRNVRPPAKTLSLSAEAMIDTNAVALVFGPENGAVSQKQVYEAAREAHAKNYSHLYVIGFAIQPHARDLVNKCAEVVGIPATYVQATPDIMMGDLLKNMRSSQIFSVCGLPEIKTHRSERGGQTQYEVELIGLDVFDPVTMDVQHRKGDDVPAWFLDTDYNGLCFHASQAFFPRTGAWESLRKALKGEYEESVWEHLAGTVSAPFEAGEHRQVAVKVIDDRGNELMVVEKLR